MENQKYLKDLLFEQKKDREKNIINVVDSSENININITSSGEDRSYLKAAKKLEAQLKTVQQEGVA